MKTPWESQRDYDLRVAESNRVDKARTQSAKNQRQNKAIQNTDNSMSQFYSRWD